ncbi:hypothetical protein OF83DRAFT_1083428 [Amylostereum chailletii]|nr:hypothetical protein OF83DRAFT_1083428 [Amylostereum chailletii]
MGGIRLNTAEIYALFLESVVYGIFFALYCAMVAVLLGESNMDPGYIRQRRWVLMVGTFMMVLGTAHLVIDLVRFIQAFVTASEGAIAYYGDLSHTLHVVKTIIYTTQTFLGDGVLIWRYYVVYNKRWTLAAPLAVVCVANLAIGYIIGWEFTRARPGTTIFDTAYGWITTFFVLTMFINVSCTVAIAVRIYSLRLKGHRSLIPTIVVIVESGALYAGGVLGLLIAYLSGTNGQYPALDIITPLTGVVFCLIILQIRFHIGSRSQLSGASNTFDGVGSKRSHIPSRLFTRRPAESVELGYPMQPVNIHITEEREMHSPRERDAFKVPSLEVPRGPTSAAMAQHDSRSEDYASFVEAL